MNLKEKCAHEAFKLIPNHSFVGLGAGTTITYLIELIKHSNLDVKIVTPSIQSKLLCHEAGLTVLDPMTTYHVDIAFDGCDDVDSQFNALKSGGGIHTLEKLIASMADDYILLIDESKYHESLTFDHPVVLEVLKESIEFVKHQVVLLGGQPSLRKSSAKDGFTITENGNYLLDVFFDAVSDVKQLNHHLKSICGVIETSLFTEEVTKVLIVNEEESRLLNREEL